MENCHVLHGRDGRDGKDGHDGREGPRGKIGPTGPHGCPGKQIIVMTTQIGPSGPTGETGPTGPIGERGETGPHIVEPGKGLFNTNSFSFTSPTCPGGHYFEDAFEIVNLIHRKDSPITYIGVAWSSQDTSTKFSLSLRDINNASLYSFSIGPTTLKNAKNICEIFPKIPILTQTTRLLKITIEIEPGYKKICIYNITIGYN